MISNEKAGRYLAPVAYPFIRSSFSVSPENHSDQIAQTLQFFMGRPLCENGVLSFGRMQLMSIH